MAHDVLIAGPASWNRIVLLDRLPDPVPHTTVAAGSWETVGGTSAGKAIGLTALGRDVLLSVQLGADAEGDRVRSLLDAVGVRLLVASTTATEQHLNLMTSRGERVSIYLAHPSEQAEDPPRDRRIGELMAESSVVVLDLSAESRRLARTAVAAGCPIWTDLHDYDGRAEFHRPFLEAADVVFMNADGTSDPVDLLGRCLRHGASFAVCTLGAEGAIALDRSGRTHRVAAVPVPVVDTNGAGDAFLSGVLDAHLSGAELPEALAAGAEHAASVLASRHLHPALDALV
ncbi:carbohydrate kinase family protein [Nocardioides albidus]|uniref:Carbohydrate kinase family protein n=1 Tax=Nocardioides albidus TaxID=1517589 RepID=A0A5C4VYW8_9ACTN|nr:carbohydrate kinase family protein [Nocardioides albidus]TNM41172.1 carbohydrate kinase family protein [Nocardioides albidus]